MTEHEEDNKELGNAARRASSIVGEYVDTIVENAERQAIETRREAKLDAERTRQKAFDSANRVLQRIDALERPLGELVGTLRGEVERMSHELDPPVEAEAVAISGTVEPEPAPEPETPPEPEPDPEPETPPEPEPDLASSPRPVPARLHVEHTRPKQQSERPSPEYTSVGSEVEQAPPEEQNDRATPPEDMPALPDVDEAPPAAEEASPAEQTEPKPQPRTPADIQPPAPASGKAKGERRLFGLLQRAGAAWAPTSPKAAKGIFITREGSCAVCQKPFMAGSEENLRLSGWRVDGEVGVCPKCQSDGWQLPDGARRPFRRARA